MTERLHTDVCPCGAPFDVGEHVVRRVSRREGDQWTDGESLSWTVTCTAGHAYDVALRANVSPRWAVNSPPEVIACREAPDDE